jgi:hypothetical protein
MTAGVPQVLWQVALTSPHVLMEGQHPVDPDGPRAGTLGHALNGRPVAAETAT